MKTKAEILKGTEELLNELEAIRGRVGILETEFDAVVEIYKLVAADNDPMHEMVRQLGPMIGQFVTAQTEPRPPRTPRPPRRRAG